MARTAKGRKLRYWYGKGRDGKWYWHGVKSRRITCDGGQGYATKHGCYTAMCKHIEDNENGNYEIAGEMEEGWQA